MAQICCKSHRNLLQGWPFSEPIRKCLNPIHFLCIDCTAVGIRTHLPKGVNSCLGTSLFSTCAPLSTQINCPRKSITTCNIFMAIIMMPYLWIQTSLRMNMEHWSLVIASWVCSWNLIRLHLLLMKNVDICQSHQQLIWTQGESFNLPRVLESVSVSVT